MVLGVHVGIFVLLWIYLIKYVSLFITQPLRCDGKRECHLEATNEYISGHRKGTDPCSGTRKYLKVEYGCEEGFKLDRGAKRIQIKDGGDMM